MQKTYNGLELPTDGAAIQYSNGQYQIPDNPIIPFIEGDGTGRDIWKASQRVFDAAVQKAVRRGVADSAPAPPTRGSATRPGRGRPPDRGEASSRH